jgi:hypothetical protein
MRPAARRTHPRPTDTYDTSVVDLIDRRNAAATPAGLAGAIRTRGRRIERNAGSAISDASPRDFDNLRVDAARPRQPANRDAGQRGSRDEESPMSARCGRRPPSGFDPAELLAGLVERAGSRTATEPSPALGGLGSGSLFVSPCRTATMYAGGSPAVISARSSRSVVRDTISTVAGGAGAVQPAFTSREKAKMHRMGTMMPIG